MTAWKSRKQIAREEAETDARQAAALRAQIERDVQYAATVRWLCRDPLLARFALSPSQIEEINQCPPKS